jgi:CheY-like chemotaxis protein
MDKAQPFAFQEGTSGKCILIVENDLNNATILYDVISHEMGNHVFLASNAAAALNFVKHITPNLLILEYRLPDMNGIELYDQLQAINRLHDVPALILLDGLLVAIEALTTPLNKVAQAPVLS